MGNRRKQDLGDTERAKTDDYAQKLYYRDEDFAVVDKISAIAKHLEVSNAQVSLAWLLQQPGVTSPIIGASKLDHLEQLVKALRLKLGEEEMRELNEGYRPHSVSASPSNLWVAKVDPMFQNPQGNVMATGMPGWKRRASVAGAAELHTRN